MVELWHKCLRRLESELSGSDVATFLRPLQVMVSEGKLVLLAPNRVVLRRVREDFLPQIRKTLTGIAGDDAPAVDAAIGAGGPAKAVAAVAPVEEDVAQAAQASGGSKLNSRHTFEAFIEGKSNAQARAYAVRVADAPGGEFNPLLIYGESGLGKTHLMHAIGNRILEKNPKGRVLYVGAERFVRDLVTAIQRGKTEDFKNHYRQVDALLIDDIHFFVGKPSTQEEFFHTFNDLLDRRQQMILTCDRYPAELDGLDKRLKSRFTWGLSVPVEPPELETRVAILQSKASRNHQKLPEDVAFFVAQRIRSNVRELEGALHRLSASSQLTGRPLTVDFARETLRDMLAAYERLITIDNIKRQVSNYFNIRLTDLSSPRRPRSLARPRQIAMSLAKELTQHSLPEIGHAFGKDHTTVLHACRKIGQLRKDDGRVREDYENLLRALSY
ncbi:MAG TPA: chromosomal replication initiator protein DnaA [Candidatus Binatia bacterium]|nr:chromosomal replication initiator protein DnaA [Candidatus Binatia bacterium]